MNNTKKEKINLKIWVLVILVILIAAAVLFALGKKTPDMDTTEPISYTTGYGELLYPQQWGERSRVSVEDGENSSTASFVFLMESGKEVPLFDIIYGCREDGAYIGEIRAENGELISVCVRSYEPDPNADWIQSDLDAFYAMQEDVNFLINQLPLVTEVPETEDIVIETDFTTLFFPGKWAGQLRTESDSRSVMFYGTVEGLPECHLFDVCFDVGEEAALGYVQTGSGEKCYVTIRIHAVEREESWSDYQMDQLLMMQEDLNFLLTKLNLQPVAPAGQKLADSNEDVTIQTPYADLIYPGEWAQYLTTQIQEGEVYQVSFQADLPGKASIALFDVAFGRDLESPSGSLTAKNGETISVMVTVQEPDFAENWSEEDRNLVFAMMEGMNAVLEHLPLNGQ